MIFHRMYRGFSIAPFDYHHNIHQLRVSWYVNDARASEALQVGGEPYTLPSGNLT